MKTKEIIIKSADVSLNFKNPYIYCTTGEGVKKINGSAISSITLLENCTIESSVFDLIHKNGIIITFQNGHNQPICRCVPYFIKIDKAAIKAQLTQTANDNKDIYPICIDWLHKKFETRMKLLEQYIPKNKTEIISKYAGSWFAQEEALNMDKTILLSKEAHTSKLYWKAYNKCIPHKFRFKKRTKNPGKDLTNALLNYGYGIFYNIIDKALMSKGVDPAIGLFHVDGPGRKSLVYDLIEPLRYHVEDMVIHFLHEIESREMPEEWNKGKIPPDIKSEYISYWKEYNKANAVTSQIFDLADELKNALIALNP